MKWLTKVTRMKIFLALLLLVAVSCQSNPDVAFTDMVGDLSVKSIPVQEGDYVRIAWLETDQIVLQYLPTEDVTLQSMQIVAVDTNTAEWRPMPFTKPIDCDVARLGSIGKLPDGRLGLIHECLFKEPSMRRIFSLYAWELSTGHIQQLQTYPRYFLSTAFSVSPESSEIIQEEGGANPQPTLHRVTENGEVVQIFPEFFRAASPTWSPDGKYLAFIGNEKGPGDKSSIFTGLVALNNVIDHPWNLYLIASGSSDPEIILTDIQWADQLKWSPDGTRIAFWGVFRDHPGIHLFDLESKEVTRVWPEFSKYDWSPDGEQLVLIDKDEPFGKGLPLVLDLR